MIPQLNILCVVDVIGALSSGSLRRCLFMVDNHPANCGPTLAAHPPGGRSSQGIGSSGLGTHALTTHTTFGQVLNWHVTGVDFQTDVRIEKITFLKNGEPITARDTPCARLGRYGAPSGEYWAGVVNAPPAIQAGEYGYKIEFFMNGRMMVTDDLSTITVSY